MRTTIKDKLTAILAYQNSTRQMGHTQTMVEGAKNVPRCVVMVHSCDWTWELKKRLPNAVFVNVNSPEMVRDLAGLKLPMVFDNAGLADVLSCASREIHRLEEVTREQDEWRKKSLEIPKGSGGKVTIGKLKAVVRRIVEDMRFAEANGLPITTDYLLMQRLSIYAMAKLMEAMREKRKARRKKK